MKYHMATWILPQKVYSEYEGKIVILLLSPVAVNT